MIFAAAVILFIVGIAHSYLGEKYILIRLFRNPLPKLFGDDTFTKQTLRFAWHLTTLAWWSMSALMILVAIDKFSTNSLIIVIGNYLATCALIALVASKGRHLSWLFFGASAILCFAAL